MKNTSTALRESIRYNHRRLEDLQTIKNHLIEISLNYDYVPDGSMVFTSVDLLIEFLEHVNSRLVDDLNKELYSKL